MPSLHHSITLSHDYDHNKKPSELILTFTDRITPLLLPLLLTPLFLSWPLLLLLLLLLMPLLSTAYHHPRRFE